MTHWYDVVGALGAAVGAIAAAGGAIAAWRAATASRATGRDALEALAIGIAPRVRVSFTVLSRGDGQGGATPPEWVAWLVNDGEFAASDVALDVHFRDGRTVRSEVEHLAPARGREPIHGGAHHEVVLGPSLPADRPFEKQADYALLRFSDERRIARYQQRYGFLFRETREGSIVSSGYGMETGELERI